MFSSPTSPNGTADQPSRPPSWQWPPLRQVALGTLIVMLIVLGFWLLLLMRSVIVAVFLGILLATMLRPIQSRLRGLLPGYLAASAALVLLIALIGAFLFIAFPLLVAQVGRIETQLPGIYENLRSQLVASPYRIVRQFGLQFAAELPLGRGSFADALAANWPAWAPVVGRAGFLVAGTLLFTYYWLIYRDRSVRGLLLILPMGSREGAEALWLRIEEKIGAFLRGQLLLAAVTGVLSLIGYWLIGLPFALLLALIAALLELIPFIGPILTALVAAIAGFSISPEMGLWALTVGVLIQQVENVLLAPRIIDEAVGVTPVITLLAFVGFAALFGPAGGLVAIPLAATIQVLFADWLARRDSTTAEEPMKGRGTIDRLRYLARDLTQDLRGLVRRKEADADDQADQADDALEAVLTDLELILERAEAQQVASP